MNSNGLVQMGDNAVSKGIDIKYWVTTLEKPSLWKFVIYNLFTLRRLSKDYNGSLKGVSDHVHEKAKNFRSCL